MILSSFSTSEIIDITQAFVAIGSLILLVVTIWLQNNSNENQKDILKMELKAKRAEYMPNIKVSILSESTSWVDDMYGGGTPSNSKNIILSIKIIKNTVTNIHIEVDNPNPDIFFQDKVFQPNAYYKEGDEIKLNYFEYDSNNIVELELIDNPKHIKFHFRIIYEDIIGNKYLQSVVYNLNTNESEGLPSVDFQ